MIVKMKKLALVVMNKDKTASLEKLRELGVVHLEKKETVSEKLTELLEQKRTIDVALGILSSFTPKKGTKTVVFPTPSNFAETVITLFEQRKHTQEIVFANNKEIARIEKWGSFNPKDMHDIATHGIQLHLYELSQKRDMRSVSKDRLIVLGRDGDSVFCVVAGEPLEYKTPEALPERSLVDIKFDNTRLRLEITGIEEKLSAYSHLAGNLKDEKESVLRQLEFETAQLSMVKEDEIEDARTISWISGYVPATDLGVIKRATAENGWALYACDPDVDDKPPTLLKNNAFFRIIKPLFDFLGTVPGYREYDISPSYLIFFCLFFAMIFGDGAYGAIIFVIMVIAGISFKTKTGKVPDAIKLFGLVSLCTVGWGAITGTWFAINQQALPQFFQSLILPHFREPLPGEAVNLREFPSFIRNVLKLPKEQPVNPVHWNIQFLCFTVALFQLVYAHIKNIKKLLPSAVAIAQLGWMTMMVGLYFLVLYMLLKIEMPSFAVHLIIIGLAVYFVFARQTGGNVFANIGKSFSDFLPTFLNAVSSFADIMSYIRLFAVGLAGASIAETFNMMAFNASGEGGNIVVVVIKILAAILILVFGHGLNMILNAVAIIVHGVRLNLLEYAGNHLKMEWSGYEYKPFALPRKDKK